MGPIRDTPTSGNQPEYSPVGSTQTPLLSGRTSIGTRLSVRGRTDHPAFSDVHTSTALPFLSTLRSRQRSPTTSMSTTTMNVALLGTGLYAQSDYIPALSSETAKQVRVHTIWSLDEAAAKACASQLSRDGVEPRVMAQKDDIEAILQDKDIDAIIMVLPFMYQPDIIRRAWKAGKHVLSEKPIERDVKAAMALVREFEENWASKGLVWRVAEGTCIRPSCSQFGMMAPSRSVKAIRRASKRVGADQIHRLRP
jgi:hypothetical protein